MALLTTDAIIRNAPIYTLYGIWRINGDKNFNIGSNKGQIENNLLVLLIVFK